jgi:hypothetical protein
MNAISLARVLAHLSAKKLTASLFRKSQVWDLVKIQNRQINLVNL